MEDIEHKWIDIRIQSPEYIHVSGYNQSSAIVDVKFADGTIGEGILDANISRTTWMTREESKRPFYRSFVNKVTHWKLKPTE